MNPRPEGRSQRLTKIGQSSRIPCAIFLSCRLLQFPRVRAVIGRYPAHGRAVVVSDDARGSGLPSRCCRGPTTVIRDDVFHRRWAWHAERRSSSGDRIRPTERAAQPACLTAYRPPPPRISRECQRRHLVSESETLCLQEPRRH